MGEIEIIARLAFVDQGHVLLCRRRDAGYTYLPGGHVEFGEGTRAALAREVDEELGVPAAVGRFLGVVENAFQQHGGPHQELSLVFAGRLPGVSFPAAPPSREAHIDFVWQPLDQLAAANLLPPLVIDLLRRDGAAGPEWLSSFDAQAE